MPHRMRAGGHDQPSSETHCSAAQLKSSREKSLQLLSSRLLRAYGHRTVTRVWSMNTPCTGACLGERGLVATDQRTDPTQKEPRRAHPQTLQRAGRQACANRRTEG
mmetsp:Transcript_2731/g.7557  ORF Transcript_2731/g.7557 Transcript_2731/m.7557 type:complete len:106 (-) Transcript_2731:450-767(-)